MNIKGMIKYRDIWMGIAMLWIMLFHSGFYFPYKLFVITKRIGYGGVDIFLFASGIGNYYSYTKDERPLPFLKRRIFRLAPIYIPFICIWGLFNTAVNHITPNVFIGNLLGVQAFSNAGLEFNWYIAILLVCYVLTPYLASFVKEHNTKQCILLIIVMIIASTAFWTDKKFIISATRLPIYTIGMLFAKYDSKEIKKSHIFVGSLLFACGIATLVYCVEHRSNLWWNYGLSWYPFIFITPFLCFLLSAIASFTERYRLLAILGDRVIKTFGKFSFEFYLVHILCFDALRITWKKLEIEQRISNQIWFLTFLTAIVGAFILHEISKPTSRILEKMCKS